MRTEREKEIAKISKRIRSKNDRMARHNITIETSKGIFVILSTCVKGTEWVLPGGEKITNRSIAIRKFERFLRYVA